MCEQEPNYDRVPVASGEVQWRGCTVLVQVGRGVRNPYTLTTSTATLRT